VKINKNCDKTCALTKPKFLRIIRLEVNFPEHPLKIQYIYFLSSSYIDLGGPFFPGGPELWHHPLAYSAAAGELPGAAALQHATLVHPALHPQVPVRSYL
jgi:hypothetical protein